MAPTRVPSARPQTTAFVPDHLRELYNRVERRRPKPKPKHDPEFYQTLIKKHDNGEVKLKPRHSDATRDNISGILGKFERYLNDIPIDTHAVLMLSQVLRRQAGKELVLCDQRLHTRDHDCLLSLHLRCKQDSQIWSNAAIRCTVQNALQSRKWPPHGHQ